MSYGVGSGTYPLHCTNLHFRGTGNVRRNKVELEHWKGEERDRVE